MALRDFNLAPLNGPFDVRSADGEMLPNAFRIVLNMDMAEFGKRCRLGGWRKFGTDSPYGFFNQDLHSQLTDCLSYQHSITEEQVDYYGIETDYTYCTGPEQFRDGCTESITMLQEVVTVSKKRILLAGTKSRIYALNERFGNWQIVADGLGGHYDADDNCACSSIRTQVCQIGNLVFFSNNVDPVLYWSIDDGGPLQGVALCNQWVAQYLTDLTALGIVRVGVIAVWQGFLFCGNVIKEGQYQTSSIYWSDFNNPLSFIPGGESAAGFIDLGRGERIVAMAPLGGYLMVYTSRGSEKVIYRVDQVGEPEIFNFKEIYRGPDGVEFQYSLVNLGAAHWWVGQAGIFALGEYDGSPQRPQWVHLASGVIDQGVRSEWLSDFDGLESFGPVNKSKCDLVVGGYDSNRKTLWFSWPTQGSECNNMSLILNLEYGGASLVDKGFMCFSMHRPDYSPSLRDVLSELGICTVPELLNNKEGIAYGMDWSSGVIPTPGTQTPVWQYDRAASWPGRPCDDSQIAGSASAYYWGLQSDQNPNDFLTGDQVGFSVALFLNEIALSNPGVVLGPIYWDWSPVTNGLSANIKWLSGITDPENPEGNVNILFDGAANLAVEFCPPGSGGGGTTNPPKYIVNATEDPNLPSDPDSVCARFEGRYLDDYCQRCEGDPLFLMSDADDLTIKQFSPHDFLRERYAGTQFAYGCPYSDPGEYDNLGYWSMMQLGANNFGPQQEKFINSVLIVFDPIAQTIPNLLHIQIGSGQQPGCITWSDTEPQDFACLTNKTAAEARAQNTRPSRYASFPTYRAGAWLTWRFFLNGTGGGGCFDSVTSKLRLKQGRWA